MKTNDFIFNAYLNLFKIDRHRFIVVVIFVVFILIVIFNQYDCELKMSFVFNIPYNFTIKTYNLDNSFIVVKAVQEKIIN